MAPGGETVGEEAQRAADFVLVDRVEGPGIRRIVEDSIMGPCARVIFVKPQIGAAPGVERLGVPGWTLSEGLAFAVSEESIDQPRGGS